MASWTSNIERVADVAIAYNACVNKLHIEFKVIPSPEILTDLELLNYESGFELLNESNVQLTLYPSLLVRLDKFVECLVTMLNSHNLSVATIDIPTSEVNYFSTKK